MCLIVQFLYCALLSMSLSYAMQDERKTITEHMSLAIGYVNAHQYEHAQEHFQFVAQSEENKHMQAAAVSALAEMNYYIFNNVNLAKNYFAQATIQDSNPHVRAHARLGLAVLFFTHDKLAYFALLHEISEQIYDPPSAAAAQALLYERYHLPLVFIAKKLEKALGELDYDVQKSETRLAFFEILLARELKLFYGIRLGKVLLDAPHYFLRMCKEKWINCLRERIYSLLGLAYYTAALVEEKKFQLQHDDAVDITHYRSLYQKSLMYCEHCSLETSAYYLFPIVIMACVHFNGMSEKSNRKLAHQYFTCISNQTLFSALSAIAHVHLALTTLLQEKPDLLVASTHLETALTQFITKGGHKQWIFYIELLMIETQSEYLQTSGFDDLKANCEFVLTKIEAYKTVSTEESQWTNLNVIGLCIPPPIELLRDWTMMRLKSFSTNWEAQNYRQDLAALIFFKNNHTD